MSCWWHATKNVASYWWKVIVFGRVELVYCLSIWRSRVPCQLCLNGATPAPWSRFGYLPPVPGIYVARSFAVAVYAVTFGSSLTVAYIGGLWTCDSSLIQFKFVLQCFITYVFYIEARIFLFSWYCCWLGGCYFRFVFSYLSWYKFHWNKSFVFVVILVSDPFHCLLRSTLYPDPLKAGISSLWLTQWPPVPLILYRLPILLGSCFLCLSQICLHVLTLLIWWLSSVCVVLFLLCH